MSDNPSTPFTVQASVAEDNRTAVLEITVNGKTEWKSIADAEALDGAIKALGVSRASMLEPVPNDISEGIHSLSAIDPRWYVVPDSENRYATLWIRHPGLGWAGYGFTRPEAASISQWLRKLPRITTVDEKLASLPPGTSSIGDDRFLFTTSGLGFYHYGIGQGRIGPNPFEQVEFDSDRAAGIVAGSIVDIRLEGMLRTLLKRDGDKQRKITDSLFRASGPLGPFSVKIDIAYLLGILSAEAYADAVNIKNIRNEFAHNIEADEFNSQSIRDRCKNFMLVDRHVGQVPNFTETESTSAPRASPYLGLPDYQKKLVEPRFRYTMTAQLISSQLGESIDNPQRTLPVI